MVASGDRFGSKLFTYTKLEQAIECGMALQKEPIRPAGWWLSRSTASKSKILMFFSKTDQL